METLKKLFEIIKHLIETKFYGSFTIKFENGKVIQCKKDESIKL